MELKEVRLEYGLSIKIENNMLNNLLRIIIGLIVFFTLWITVIPSILLWIIVDRNYILDVIEWVITGEYPY